MNIPTVTAAEYNELLAECRALRARVAELESRLAEIEAQEPAFWYVPADDEDGEDALLNSCRDGTCPAVGAIPLYTRHAAPQPVKEDTK